MEKKRHSLFRQCISVARGFHGRGFYDGGRHRILWRNAGGGRRLLHAVHGSGLNLEYGTRENES